jgi:hypothetical protein
MAAETPNHKRQNPKKQQRSNFDFSLEFFLGLGALAFGICAAALR